MHVRAVRRVLIVAREVAMDRVSDTWLTKSERYFLNSHPAPSTSLSEKQNKKHVSNLAIKGITIEYTFF